MSWAANNGKADMTFDELCHDTVSYTHNAYITRS